VGDASVPVEIQRQSISFGEDAALVIQDLLDQKAST
jgi:hypothetical protein